MRKKSISKQTQFAFVIFGLFPQTLIAWADNPEYTASMQNWGTKIAEYYSVISQCSVYVATVAIACCAVALLFSTDRERDKLVGRIRNIIIAFIVIRCIPYVVQGANELSRTLGGGLPAAPVNSPSQ